MTSALAHRSDSDAATPAAATGTATVPAADGTPRPVVVLLRPAPRREPPFDDELPAGVPGLPVAVSAGRPAVQPRLPFPVETRHLTLVRPTPQPSPSPVPDPAVWARRLLIGIAEVAAGRRPIGQLAPLLSPALGAGLRHDLVDVPAHGGRRHWTSRAAVQSVHSSRPAEQVAEVAATVRVGDRVRAVALRLEVRHRQWCCTRLVLG